MPAQPPLFSPPHLTYTHTSLAQQRPQRPDSRAPLSFRALRAETGLLPATYGSARVCGADGTEVVVGVRGEVVRCADADADAGDHNRGSGEGEGWVEVAVQMQMQEDAAGAAAGMEDVLQESLASDASLASRLRLGPRWRWKIFVDILLLSPPTPSPLPLLSLTAHLALLATRLPAPLSGPSDDPVFADDWDAARPLYAGGARPPVTVLVVAVGANVFADPAPEELAVADAGVAVSFRARPRGGGLQLLAVRTVETPGGVGARVGEAEDGAWRRRRGGVARGVLKRMVGMVVGARGVGEEVLKGLERWV